MATKKIKTGKAQQNAQEANDSRRFLLVTTIATIVLMGLLYYIMNR
jgi:predicted secreted protein